MTSLFDVLLVASLYALMALFWAGVILVVVLPVKFVLSLFNRRREGQGRTRRHQHSFQAR